MKQILSMWYPSADQWNRAASGWVPITDQFWDFANNFENDNNTIINEISFEILEPELSYSTICNNVTGICQYFFMSLRNVFCDWASNGQGELPVIALNMNKVLLWLYNQILGGHFSVFFKVASLALEHMMTSSNGNMFRVTGHLCGEFTGPRWIPHTKASDAELWCLLWSASE